MQQAASVLVKDAKFIISVEQKLRCVQKGRTFGDRLGEVRT